MNVIATIAVLVVAALHAYFLVLEMFLWTRPAGLRTFRLDAAFAERSKSLAANQGLYNGFLVAGLLWSVAAHHAADAADRPGAVALAGFFLGCVIVAGVFGAVTVGKRILFVQAVPAAIALALVLVGWSR